LDKPEELRTFGELARRLGQGESATIAYGIHHGYTVALDDKAARKHVAPENLTGTIGLLREAIEQGQVDLEAARCVLQKMVSEGYYSPIDPTELT